MKFDQEKGKTKVKKERKMKNNWEKNIEEEEEHNDGQAKRVDAIDSFADDEWVEFPSPRVQFG